MARKVVVSVRGEKMMSLAMALREQEFLFKRIRAGEVFIYPTDTIYGMGCDASISSAVSRIRDIKGRDQRPLSVIVPSKEWIVENCVIEDKRVLDLLPGPYTLVFRLRGSSGIVTEVTGNGTLGVRIPNHPIAGFVTAYGRPMVTTSVNESGKPPLFLGFELRKVPVDFIIFEGDRVGAPSTIVDTVRKLTITRPLRRE